MATDAPDILRAFFQDESEVEDVVFAPQAPSIAANLSPAIFIGLGGSGAKIVDHLMRLLGAQYGGEERIPEQLQFMVIDTDPGVAALFTQRTRPIVRIINDFNGNTYIREGGREFTQDWWPKKFWPGAITMGAKQTRAVGRLAMFHHATDLIQDLEGMAQRAVAEVDNLAAPPLVFIFASSCGGTGAGMAIDMGYLVRDIFRGMGQAAAKTIGVILSPSAYSDVIRGGALERIPANAYALLKELENFHDRPAFPANYPGRPPADIAAFTSGMRPFYITYWIDSFNCHGRSVGKRDDLFALIANYTAMEYLTYKDAAHGGQLSNLDNCGAFIRDRIPGLNLAPVLSSFGYASYVFPRERLQRYSLLRMMGSIVREGLLAPAPEKPSTEEMVRTFVQKAELQEDRADQCIDALMQCDPKSAERPRYTISSNRLLGDPLVETRTALMQHEQHFEESLAQLPQMVSTRRSAFYARVLKTLDEECTVISGVAQGGLDRLIRFLDQMISQCNVYTAQMAHEGDGLEAEIAKVRRQRADMLAEAQVVCAQRTIWLFPKVRETRETLDKYAGACVRQFNLTLEAVARSEASTLYADLSSELHRRRNALERLRAKLTSLAVRCEEGKDTLFHGSGPRAGVDDTRMRVTFFALDGMGIEQAYEQFVSRGSVHGSGQPARPIRPQRLVIGLPDHLQSIWSWIAPAAAGSGEPGSYTLALTDAEMRQSVQALAQDALDPLLQADMRDILGQQQLTRRLVEAARQVGEMWTIDGERVPEQHWNAMPRHVVIAVEDEVTWKPYLEAIESAIPGAAKLASRVSTGDRDHVSIAVAHHGAPAFAHTMAAGWKYHYTQQVDMYTTFAPIDNAGVQEGGPKPVHIVRDWENLPNPEPRQAEYLEMFALASAFPVPGFEDTAEPPHILHLKGPHAGAWVDLYPYPDQGASLVRQQLAQGLRRAWEMFDGNESLLAQVRPWFGSPVDFAQSVLSRGNEYMSERIVAHRQALWALRPKSASDAQSQKLRQLIDSLINALMNYYDTVLHGDSRSLPPLTES